jgi:adenylosuccinate synthase
VGLGPTKIDSVIGICKAYTTRVGGGPFVTELSDDIGDRIQRVGQEFGATTGRRRRCGWLDIVLVRQSARLSGVTGLALTKLDVLTGIDPLNICTGYRSRNVEFTESVPSNLRMLEDCEPVYEAMAGWTEDIGGARRIEELPRNARKYVEKIEELSGVPVVLISVGPGREETIVLEDPF